MKDIHWLKPDGVEMSDEEWNHEFARGLGVLLVGAVMDEHDGRGRVVRDDNLLLLFNAHHEPLDFRLPELDGGCEWETLLDTYRDQGLKGGARYPCGEPYPLAERSLVLLKHWMLPQ